LSRTSSHFHAHYLSALARSLFTNSSQIYINSVFVNTLGGKSYSDLFFFASFFTIIYYVYFAVAGERKAYLLYKTVLGLSLIGLALFFAQPLAAPVLYYFAVAVVVVDLIGTNLGPIVLQASVNPAIFRELFQRIVSVELLARISAAGFVCLLSQFHLPRLYFVLAALTLVAHFILFDRALRHIADHEKETDAKKSGNGQSEPEKSDSEKSAKVQPGGKQSAAFIESISSSMRFILSNPLARIALTIMVWTHVTKFLVEYLFYQVAAANFQSASQIASFVSATVMTMIVLSLLVQRAVGKKLSERLQLSTLFSLQPINILVLGSIALLGKPFWTLVILMVTYQCINRSIQLPVSRQCLLPVPRAQRGSIASLISLSMAVAALVTSGMMSALKSALSLQDFLILLLLLSGMLFFLITRMDAFYIRNLWSFYRERRSGTWSDMPPASELCPDEMGLSTPATDASDGESAQTAPASDSILQDYANCYERSSLASASAEHRRLLRSKQTKSVLQALRVSFISGFPWFASIYSKFQSSPEKEIQDFAVRALRVNTVFARLPAYSSRFRRKIRTLALEFLEDEPQESKFLSLQNVLQLSDHAAAELLVEALASSRFKDMQTQLLHCLGSESSQLSLNPLIENMMAASYSNATKFRELLEHFSEAKLNTELLEKIKPGIEALRQSSFSVWSAGATPAGTEKDLKIFKHLLFLEEYRLCRHKLDKAFTDTISEFSALGEHEKMLLADMHLEYLKASEFFADWVELIQKKAV
jgi:hypothetical protein